MSAAAKLAKAWTQVERGNTAKAVRLGWDAANDALTERDAVTLAGVEELARELVPVEKTATSLAEYCAGVLAGGPDEVRAATVLDKYLRKDPPRRPCPQCGESIAREARLCRFCGLEIAPSA